MAVAQPLVKSVYGTQIGTFAPSGRSYWAARLSTGQWVCELDWKFEQRNGMMRPFDWTLDLLDNSDIKKIKELWLFCPPHPGNPLGSTARLPIVEPCTAFQLKVNNANAFDSAGRQFAAQLIGRVDDKVTGDAVAFVWDAQMQSMSQPWKCNAWTGLGTWAGHIAPIGAISHVVMGLELG